MRLAASKTVWLGIAIACIIALGVLGWTYWHRPAVASLFPQNLASRSHFDIATDGGVVTLGNSQTPGVEPAVVFGQDASDSHFGISYQPVVGSTPVVEDNLVKWQSGEQQAFFKYIPKNTSPTAAIPAIANPTTFRYIPMGSASLDSFAASYQLFAQRLSTSPTITTFVPNQDGYVFYGQRPAESDLKDVSKLSTPIARVAADDPSITCPVIPVTAGGVVAGFVYYPHIDPQKSTFADALTDSLNAILRQRGITTEVKHSLDSFYYMQGAKPVFVGRMSFDTHHYGFFLYIDSPYTSELKEHLRQRISLLDTVTLPYGSLKDLDATLSADILPKLMSGFAQQDGMELKSDHLTSDESSDLQAMVAKVSNSEWRLNAIQPTNDDIRNYDRFEFDITLQNQPTSNIFTYAIDSTNLDFVKQPKLTEQDLEQGLIVNSSLAGGYVGTYIPKSAPAVATVLGNQPQATLIINRPKVIDATGQWTWAELSIDQSAGTLQVIAPADFLAHATYPVIIDPTFGQTLNNNSGLRTSGMVTDTTMASSKFTLTEDAVVTALHFYTVPQIPSANCKAGIYDGTTDSFIASSLEVATTTEGWYQFLFSQNPTLPAGSYWLSALCEGWTNGNRKSQYYGAYTLATGSGMYKLDVNYGSFPSSLAGQTKPNPFDLSIYADYTPAGAAPTGIPQKKTFGGGVKIQGGTKIGQ